MTACAETCDTVTVAEKPAWTAVFAVTLGVFALITAEFLPASLLTPMAASLGVTEGMAGLAAEADPERAIQLDAPVIHADQAHPQQEFAGGVRFVYISREGHIRTHDQGLRISHHIPSGAVGLPSSLSFDSREAT